MFLLAVALQLGYGAWLFSMLANIRRRPEESQTIGTGLTILVCAKNEESNLARNLPSLLEQAYHDGPWEVLVVDDASTDGTPRVLGELARSYPHLHVLRLEEGGRDLPGKKHALAQGIAHARHDRILFTDADCAAASVGWATEMSGTEAPIVLGYGAYRPAPGALNRFVRWETVHTCMQYASYAKAGKPYMGVGRNMCYDRGLWKALENDTAFQKTYARTPSGDDDLVILRLAIHYRAGLCLRPRAHTCSVAPVSWKKWWHQKGRHLSTGKYYPAATSWKLGAYALSHGLYWSLGILLVAHALWTGPMGVMQKTLIALFLLRLGLYWSLMASWGRYLQEKGLFYFYPLGDLGWAFYNLLLSPYIFWKNKNKWK